MNNLKSQEANSRTDRSQPTLPAELTAIVAELIDLRQQVKQSHWNVIGSNFIGLHRLFDGFAEELDKQIDLVAERQRALDFPVRGTIRDAVELSTLKDSHLDMMHAEDVLCHLVANYRQLSADLNGVIETMTEGKDYGTADLCTDCVRVLDQHLYLMTSHFD